MRKIDVSMAILTGLGLAWLASTMVNGSGFRVPFLEWALFIFLPIFVLLGLWVADILGKRFVVISQIAKFVLIGSLATILNLVLLNILMGVSGIVSGSGYTVFLVIAFIIATAAKYLGNKLWAFEKSEMAEAGREVFEFALVTLIGMGLYTAIASFIVNSIGPQWGVPAKIWANIGAILASLIIAVWNFLGYKFIVFKK